MITLKFSKNSWHYRLASFGTDKVISDNLCGYFWQVLWGFIWFIWSSLCVILIAYCMLAEPIAYLLAVFNTGVWVRIDTFLLVGLCCWAFILLIVAVSLFYELSEKLKEKRRLAAYQRKFDKINEVERKDNFIVAIWHKVHDKTCAKLEFK